VGNYGCLDLATATQQIQQVGLVLGTVTAIAPPPAQASPPPNWLVIQQLPPPGTTVPVNSPVNLTVQDPTQPCPP
jgi:beta-lactam-binding protein with PASTA domain